MICVTTPIYIRWRQNWSKLDHRGGDSKVANASALLTLGGRAGGTTGSAIDKTLKLNGDLLRGFIKRSWVRKLPSYECPGAVLSSCSSCHHCVPVEPIGGSVCSHRRPLLIWVSTMVAAYISRATGSGQWTPNILRINGLGLRENLPESLVFVCQIFQFPHQTHPIRWDGWWACRWAKNLIQWSKSALSLWTSWLQGSNTLRIVAVWRWHPSTRQRKSTAAVSGIRL